MLSVARSLSCQNNSMKKKNNSQTRSELIMKRFLLYLDFDGVLHPASACHSRPFSRADALAECIAGSKCEVVISSSWRHQWTLTELLDKLPIAIANRVIGTTGEAYIGKFQRYNEIQRHLMSQAEWRQISWRALDDSFMEFPKSAAELILCNPSFGLMDNEQEKLRGWLQFSPSSVGGF